jgi:hypothetical protein
MLDFYDAVICVGYGLIDADEAVLLMSIPEEPAIESEASQEASDEPKQSPKS